MLILILHSYNCIIQATLLNYIYIPMAITTIRFLVGLFAGNSMNDHGHARCMLMPWLITWKSHVLWKWHMSWKCHNLSRGKFFFFGKPWNFTCKILRGAMHVHTCKSEVIKERYCNRWYEYLFNLFITRFYSIWITLSVHAVCHNTHTHVQCWHHLPYYTHQFASCFAC